MRRSLFSISISLLVSTAPAIALAQQTVPTAVPHPAADYGKLPLSFEANQGQTDPQVRFTSRGNGYALFLTGREAVLSLTKDAPRSAKTPSLVKTGTVSPAKTDILRMQLSGANAQATVAGVDPLPGTANYFLGSDPTKWHTNVPTYAKVQYKNVYDGIDLVYYGNQRQLEYDFIVQPGHSPKSIQLHFAGAQKLTLTPQGDLDVLAKNGQIAFHKPILYQEKDGQRQPIEGRFTLQAKNNLTFTVGKYDESRALIIDPTLAYSTYLGGSGSPQGDFANAIAVDANGSVYVAGAAGSNDFPISPSSPSNPTAVQTTYKSAINETNAFVTRLNSTGTAIIYSTYLGGQGTYRWGDAAQAIAVDGYGNAYVAGFSGSPGLNSTCGLSCEFPITPGAYQTVNKATANYARTAFVTKLSADGTQLIYSTFVGGSGNTLYTAADGDTAYGIAIDSQGDAFIAGTTYSFDYPVTAGAIQSVNNAKKISGSNLFVTKLNPTGSNLIYSTYLGGSGFPNGNSGEGDFGTSIAVDGDGNAYVAGYAHSVTDYPITKGAYQTTNKADSSINNNGGSNTNAVISKLDPTGTQLVYSTYLGGSANEFYGDQGLGIAVDREGFAYVAGQAASQNFPVTPGAFQTVYDNNVHGYGWSGFITKLNATGTQLSYSTYLSGTGGSRFGDWTTAIAIDAADNAYVTGTAFSTDFPITPGAYQSTNKQGTQYGDTGETFFTEINSSGSELVYSSYLGGSGSDRGEAIAVDPAGNAYIAGQTFSSDFPVTKGVFQSVNKAQAAKNTSSSNAFISKFGAATNYSLVATKTAVSTSAATQTQGDNVTFTVSVKPATGGETPSGIVGLSIDGGPIDFLTLGGNGSAQYSSATLSPTKHTISARFYGDVFFAASQGSVSETIVGIPASIKTASGSGPSCTYGSACPNPIVFLVEDSLGNPVNGAAVTPTAPGFKFSPATGTTGANGEASFIATSTAYSATTYGAASVSGVTTTAPFTLHGKKASLTVTAANATVGYDQPLPVFTCTLSGFVNGDTPAAVSGKCAVTTTAKNGSPVGTYKLIPSQGTLAAANYSFGPFVDGTLTITDAAKSPTPVISPLAGTYTSFQIITITDAVAETTINYTTDGTTPTSASTKYTAPILVDSSETIQAIATLADHTNSSIATSTYKIIGSPSALAGAATAITATSATLKAELDTYGLAGSFYFQYGTSSTALTSTTAKNAISASATEQAASAKLATLKSNTTYYYQVTVTTAAGTATSAVESFTTE